MVKSVLKTRLAPTPSGFLHLGNAFSFVITAAIAHRYGAKILLRIDDLDQARVRDEYVRDIFKTLNFLGIKWDEGPDDFDAYKSTYSQYKRMDLYHESLQKLKDLQAIFGCRCSRKLFQRRRNRHYPCSCVHKNISLDGNATAWRMKTDQNPIWYKSFESPKQYDFLPESMQYFVVRRKDGVPAYQLASLCDDLHFGVNLIVRGEDLFPSSLAQLFLANSLQEKHFSSTIFHHHPLILDKKGEKLAKSAGSKAIAKMNQKGMPAEAFYRYFSEIMGWDEKAQSLNEFCVMYADKYSGLEV